MLEYVGLAEDPQAPAPVPRSVRGHLTSLAGGLLTAGGFSALLWLIGWIDAGTAVLLAVAATVSAHLHPYAARWGRRMRRPPGPPR